MLETSGIFTTSQIRDLRLSEMGQILDVAYRGMTLTLNEASRFDDTSNEVLENLLLLENVYRRIRPLGGTRTSFFRSLCVYRLTTAFHPPLVVVKQEQFHCETLHFLYYACRLLVLHRALSFVHMMDQRDRRWVHTQNPKDLNISIIWGSDALSTADAILTTFCSLSERDRRCLSAAPDIIFTLTTLAAAFVFIVKFRSLQDYGIEIAGVHNELLWVVVDRMTDVALHAEHAPAKYAKLITTWMRKWENAARNSDTGAAASTSAAACGSRSQPLADPREANSSTHPDFYLDEDFWSSFINPFSFSQDGELCPLRLNHSLSTTELFRYLSLPATPIFFSCSHSQC